VAQQQEIRKAAADMGRFELVLEPFDWDADEMAARPVSAERLPGLEVRFREVRKDRPDEPGEPVEASYAVRGQPRLDAEGSLHEVLELRAKPTWIEIAGRGAGGQTCAPSLILARALPTYAEREAVRRVPLKVPTCQATRAGTVEVPAGPFAVRDWPGEEWREQDLPAYRIDTYEVTQEAYAVYASMSAVTGDEAVYPPPGVTRNQRKLPMTQLDAWMAERLCAFMGKRLESVAEWQKAARGGLWLDSERKVPNPAPRRVTPWGTLDFRKANLGDPGASPANFPRFLPVGSFADDRGPSGAFDLIGSGTEWTRDRLGTGTWTGLRVVVGGNWTGPEITQMKLFQIDRTNAHVPFVRNLATVARCTSSP
jgi:eukaryotic-like serine/threonine-protein kinase